ncbi:hypothetical protein AU195_19940 [Mycobacterium sp. IS-1496]|uniref:hypothetical protein n=1 Tax=Mycobacterium sp. IS-1496 TaxID=1772284 RepID=UPI00074175E2|nr:hypothetical protein [Mycobacterium sp. IS-1496]KUI27494.1 hypothetical protein AU195_19940 [Mycobacterium sp. IS-1496]
MKFVLEVNLPDDADVNGELGRILTGLADEIKDLTELEPGDKQDLYDSTSARVGDWHVTADAE